MTRCFQVLQAVACALPAMLLQAETCLGHEQSGIVAGWAETVTFHKLGLSLKAKLDTGARTSSLHAHDIQMFSRDGAKWVQFSLRGARGEMQAFERPLHRMSTVKRAGTAPEKRPVVLLSACVAGVHRTSEFNLKNRAGMSYPVLIGRSFLGHDVLVNASAKNLHEGRCPAK